jgi:hypothetical protein
MAKCLVIKNDDDTVKCIFMSKSWGEQGRTVDDLKALHASDLEDREYIEIEETELPNREFRDNWRLVNGSIEIAS